MNKLLKVLAASALVATVLVGCGKKGESTGGAAEGAKYAKAGLGVVSTVSEGQVNTTFAGVGLDADGKVQWIDIDVAQGTPNGGDAQYTQTKEQRGSDYGMKDTSAQMGNIEGGAEWDAQAAAYEKWATGKTAKEIANVETMDFHGGKAAKTGSELAAGCTITIDDFQAAVAKAIENAQEVSTDNLSLGRAMSYESDTYQEPWTYLTTDLALVATDADGKIQWLDIETAKIAADGSQLKTKTELGDEYAMKSTSAQMGNIEGGAEWDQQAASFETWAKGKTADEVAKAAGEDGKPTDTDLSSGCTISITQFQAAVDDALK